MEIEIKITEEEIKDIIKDFLFTADEWCAADERCEYFYQTYLPQRLNDIYKEKLIKTDIRVIDGPINVLASRDIPVEIKFHK